MDYWNECIAEAFDDAEIPATKEQISTVASWVEGAHENYGLATGADCIPNPLENENKALKRELAKERDKVNCSECGGSGRIITDGPVHSSDSTCWGCNGDGRINP